MNTDFPFLEEDKVCKCTSSVNSDKQILHEKLCNKGPIFLDIGRKLHTPFLGSQTHSNSTAMIVVNSSGMQYMPNFLKAQARSSNYNGYRRHREKNFSSLPILFVTFLHISIMHHFLVTSLITYHEHVMLRVTTILNGYCGATSQCEEQGAGAGRDLRVVRYSTLLHIART
jgi:hypothetical protein